MQITEKLEVKALQEVYELDLWETCLHNKDQELARQLIEIIKSHQLSWREVCNKIGYPHSNAFIDEYMGSHFKRVLIEISLLSVYGDHTWKHYGGKNAQPLSKKVH